MAEQPAPSLLSTLVTNTGATVATCVIIAAGVMLSTNLLAKPSGEADVRPAVVAAVAAPAPAAVRTPIDPKMISPEQRAAFETIIREYLLSHPEILVEVSKELETKQQAMAAAQAKVTIAEKKAQIYRSAGDFVLGNPQGDITVVEFFDYNCGWCKKSLDEVQKLIKSDPKVRVVMKELPIFGGPNSMLAAKAAVASISQGKYWDFHQALMRERQVTADNLFKVAEKAGLDVAKLKADMAKPEVEATIKETMTLAQNLGIEGTPGFMVDAKINPGYLPHDQIVEMITDVRKTGGCTVC